MVEFKKWLEPKHYPLKTVDRETNIMRHTSKAE